MTPQDARAQLDALRQRYEEAARRELETAPHWKRFGNLKVELVRQAEADWRNEQKIRRFARAGQLSPEAEENFQEDRRNLTAQARKKADLLVEAVNQRFGPATLPKEPISDSKHLLLLVAQLDRMEDEELMEKVVTAVTAGDRATAQTLSDEVTRRIRKERFESLPESHPLAVAQEAVALAHANHQTVANELAAERAQSHRHQLERVIRTVEDRGRWTGPMATMEPRSTPDFPPAGPAEISVRGTEDDRQGFADWAESLPTDDPTLLDPQKSR